MVAEWIAVSPGKLATQDFHVRVSDRVFGEGDLENEPGFAGGGGLGWGTSGERRLTQRGHWVERFESWRCDT
jgi:hypothetical protein